MGGVVDYVGKFCLTCPVTATKTWREAVACLESARERAGEVLGRPLIQDLVDPESGELRPVTVVTDNGSCYRARGFRSYIHSRPEFEHVRTRHRSPETNGVIERWFQSLKYEHLYLQEIDDGPALAEHVAEFNGSTTTSARTRRSTSACPASATSRRQLPSRTSREPVSLRSRDLWSRGSAPGPGCQPAASGRACHPKGGPTGRARSA